MAEPVRIVIDAMGGDNAPSEPVRAAVEAVSERKDIKIFLTGLPQVLEQELKKYVKVPKDRLVIVPASEVIETAEPPVAAIRKKKPTPKGYPRRFAQIKKAPL